MPVNRRSFLRSSASCAVACPTGTRLFAAEDRPASGASYKRANTDWLAKCRFGVGVHWTAQTVPRSGPPKPFQEAVDKFDLDDRRWVHTKRDTPITAPLYTDEQVIGYVQTCNSHRTPMNFNVGVYQDGTMADASVEQLHRLNRALRS